MTHRTIHEWGRVPLGSGGFSRDQANLLLAAARAHPAGGREGTDILCDHHDHLTARQTVGVLAAGGCSLEILPKIDPEAPDEAAPAVRTRLIHMLDAALGFELSADAPASIARQQETLLDLLIRLFADRLLAEVRRGLPRRYLEEEEDLRALRGRLDHVRQFSIHAVRPDRLACRFDRLAPDTPLLRIMKACVVFLAPHAAMMETRRKLEELRFRLAEVSDIPPSVLRWNEVRIDRTSRRWRTLLDLARLFVRREWQATHHDSTAPAGLALLFPMNDLFEAYVAALLRRSLAPLGIEVAVQGGLRHCLGDWSAAADCEGRFFQTRPDILLRRHGRILAIIDSKWKKLSGDSLDGKHGVAQSDVYQLMAYARIYGCDRLMLLYPAPPGTGAGIRRTFGIAAGRERLDIATIDLAGGTEVSDLLRLTEGMLADLAA